MVGIPPPGIVSPPGFHLNGQASDENRAVVAIVSGLRVGCGLQLEVNG